MASNKGQNLCLVSARRLEIDIIMSYSDVFVILLIIYSVFTFDWYNVQLCSDDFIKRDLRVYFAINAFKISLALQGSELTKGPLLFLGCSKY